MNVSHNSLKNLISPNLYSQYSSILTLSDIPLFLLDISGEIIHELIPSPNFCTHICQKEESRICSDYLYRLKNGHQGMFHCKYGLKNIILPITVSNKTIGYIAGFRAYLEEDEYKKHMIDINSFGRDMKLEFIAKSISTLPTADANKIKTHKQLCVEISNNLSLDLSETINFPNNDLERLSIEKEILEKKIIDLEAKNMSLAVNPHFLFNTLNCIARIAYFEKSPVTEELIYCLSDLLRYNLKQGDQLHTIDAEIANIEKYLYIQKSRFKNRMEYSIQVPDEVKSYKILNMIIQPIVENAIIHGISPKRDGGKVNIHAEKYKDEISIFISDNGSGFSENFCLNFDHRESGTGLGFKHTDKRLKQYYGEQYGLEIVKSDYSGSTVAINIPTHPIVR